jgi:MFS superfamily sulfate permease-like transporter
MINHHFTGEVIRKDAIAGTITGLMAIPLTIGICLMSEYPIQTGLMTVVLACVVGFVTFLFRPGNYVGVPGVAAGLAPVLAMGIHTFGMANMPFLIFLTSFFQMLVWKNHWERYILKAVPAFLVEGLLAGVGIKIALKFLPYTYETKADLIHVSAIKAHGTESLSWEQWLDPERIQVISISITVMLLFLYLFSKFKKTSPGLPYVIIIVAGILIAQYVSVPMLHIEPHELTFKVPLPEIDMHHPIILLKMIGYALMLATIDVIEQVMSNVAIEKLDEKKRPADSNNSLLAIWVANMGASFFGGMTNLDGLAKSTTNSIAGAQTKLSNLFTGAVLLFFALEVHYLEYLPEFSLAVLMVFTGWKMIAGVFHVAAEGQYPFMLSLFCGILVWRLGIFEGLLIALIIHGVITFFIDRHHDTPITKIIKNFLGKFVDDTGALRLAGMNIETDEVTGGKRFRTIRKSPSDKKSLTVFIKDWGDAINKHNLLGILNHYDYDALLWGTFAKDLGAGHIPIKKYFEHLLELKDLNVSFQEYETRQYNDIFIQSGSYIFSYTKRGERHEIPARYSFVCKKDRNSWFILEHHSSMLPET